MANELVTRNNNAVATPAASGNPFLQAAGALGGNNDGLTFAGFSGKTGDYTYGADKEELDPKWQGAVNMSSAARGWILWIDGSVEGEEMVKILEGTPPLKSNLEDPGPLEDDDDGWSEQFSFEVGEMESGERLLFKNGSKSGLRAFGNLLSQYGKAIQKGQNIGEDGAEMHPIVEFDATEFTPKNGKKKDKAYAPKFSIVDWISEEELEEKFGGEDDPENYEAEEAPAKETKKVTKATKTEVKAAEVESEDETPAEDVPAEGGRRRRRFA
jgi:hypothetical protein